MTTAWGLYGQSLYDLAVEEKADEQIMEELDWRQSAVSLRRTPIISRFSRSPRSRSKTVLSCWMRPSADRSILIC